MNFLKGVDLNTRGIIILYAGLPEWSNGTGLGQHIGVKSEAKSFMMIVRHLLA